MSKQMKIMNKNKRISKSQYLKGIQCPKRLWLYRHRPDLIPEIEDSQQRLFDVGYEIHELARQHFRGNVEVSDKYYEIDQAVQSTRAYIRDNKKTICEATASSKDGVYSRIDILKKVRGSDKWDMIEVKGATKVKEYHYDDMALQRFAFKGAGYKIRKSILMHINKQYVRSGELDLKQLYTMANCTAGVLKKMKQVKQNVGGLLKILKQDTEPDIEPGDQCHDNPYDCEYIGHCDETRPEFSVYNVFKKSKAKLELLLGKDIVNVEDVPDDFKMTKLQSIAVDCHKNNKAYKDNSKIREFLDTLVYPLYYFDFETIWPAIPLFDRSSPYQQIPFQFSLHVQKKKGGNLKHIEYLHTGTDDPRPGLIKAMFESCGKKGSVVVYNRSFEKNVNTEMGNNFLKYRSKLNKISERMVDLMKPFESRYFYHPKMKGSHSIKKVLPALVPAMSYDDMDIADGGDASARYMDCIKGLVSEKQKGKIFKNLRTYCGLDTLAEAKLVEALYKSI